MMMHAISVCHSRKILIFYCNAMIRERVGRHWPIITSSDNRTRKLTGWVGYIDIFGVGWVLVQVSIGFGYGLGR